MKNIITLIIRVQRNPSSDIGALMYWAIEAKAGFCFEVSDGHGNVRSFPRGAGPG